VFSSNSAQGGHGYGWHDGAGAGAAVFNLNGVLTLDATLLQNNAASTNGSGVYNLAYGNKIGDGSAVLAQAILTGVTLINNRGGDTLVNDQPTGVIPSSGLSNNPGNVAMLITQGTTSLTTGAATALTGTTATLNGTVNGYSSATYGNTLTVFFQYTTTAGNYTGSPSVYATTLGASTDTAVSAGITGLAPRTTYYYRVVVTSSATGATYYGNEQSFTTPKASPVFSNLLSPSIPYGTATVALSGHLADSTASPVGETVSVTLDGMTQPATLDGSGNFSTTFNTAALGVAGSPYSITYQYGGDASFNSASASTTLTVTSATPNIAWSPPAPITYGTPLSATQLDAQAGWTVGGSPVAVAGTFTYTPAANAILSAGSQTLAVHFVPADTIDYTPADQTVTLTVTTVTPNIAWSPPAPITYGTPLSAAQLDAQAGWTVGGSPVAVAGTFTYTPAANAILSAGSQTLAVHFVPADTIDYTPADQTVTLTVNPAVLTVTAGNATRIYGAANPAFTYSITGFVNNDPTSVVSGTPTLSTTATAASAPGNYPITVDVTPLSAANYTFQAVSGTLTVTAAPLSASPLNFSATAGAPFSGTVATFTTPDKLDGAAAFSAVITWGDGSTSTGVITGGSGSFTVCGSHTYAAAGSYAACVQVSNPDTQSATANDTAKVASLNQGVTTGMTGGIGFWHNANGQALIDSFNGGPSATALGSWLAASFPNLYGAGAGGNCLAGKSNAQVAAYYQTLFALGGPKAQAQVLATALNVYATTSSLGGTAGVAYGFAVSATGLGARSYGVGQDGAAFGVANGSTLTVYGLLAAVNRQAVNGVLYGGNAALQGECADLLGALNQAGSIG
jgi:hypothetical protein